MCPESLEGPASRSVARRWPLMATTAGATKTILCTPDFGPGNFADMTSSGPVPAQSVFDGDAQRHLHTSS